MQNNFFSPCPLVAVNQITDIKTIEMLNEIAKNSWIKKRAELKKKRDSMT